MTTESPEYYRERYKRRMAERKPNQKRTPTRCPYCDKPSRGPCQGCLVKVLEMQDRDYNFRHCEDCMYEMRCSSIVFDSPKNGEEVRYVMCEAPEALCRVYKACKRGTVGACWYWTEGGRMHFREFAPNEAKPHKTAVPCCDKCRAAMESAEAAGLLGVEV